MSQVDVCLLVCAVRTQQRAHESFSSYFRVRIGLQLPDIPDALRVKSIDTDIDYSYLTTKEKKEIMIHTITETH